MKAGVRTTEALGGGALIVYLVTQGQTLPLPTMICVSALAAVYIVARTVLKAKA